jgi:lipoprotein Spr
MKKLLIIVFLFSCVNLSAQCVEDKRVDEFVCEWLGVKYRFGGTKKLTGVDCSYLVKEFYKKVYNIELERVARKQWEQTKRILKTELKIGDLVFFDSKQSPSKWHVGIFIGNNKFIHAANYLQGVIISDLCEPNYEKNYKGAGRF